jgi:DNA-binding IclR family transcriptional regulator
MAEKTVGKERYRIEAVHQAGKILKAIAESRNPIGPSEVAKELEITVNTAFRMCITLEELGFLKQVGDKYDLGMGLALFWARKKAILEGERNGIDRQLTELG